MAPFKMLLVAMAIMAVPLTFAAEATRPGKPNIRTSGGCV